MEGNKLSKLLTSEEQRDLLAFLNSPAWRVVLKLADEVKSDWVDQGMNKDFAGMDDAQVARHLAKFSGMKKGMDLFHNYLEHWKRVQNEKSSEQDS